MNSKYPLAAIDLSHWQAVMTNPFVSANPPYGYIHKATDGLTGVDSMWKTRRNVYPGKAWATYHFGENVDGVSQAHFYLATVAPKSNELVCLDVEYYRGIITLPEMEKFGETIHEARAQWPILYSSKGELEIAGYHGQSSSIQEWPLWLAGYVPESELQLPPGFSKWTLWQFTDNYGGFDASYFNGTQQELEAFWPLTEQTF